MTETYKTGDQVTINKGARCAIMNSLPRPRITRAVSAGYAGGPPWRVIMNTLDSLTLNRTGNITDILVHADDVTRYPPRIRRTR